MYGIWRKIRTSSLNKNGTRAKDKKQYIGQISDYYDANCIYDNLISKPNLAIANKCHQADVWYGFNPLKHVLPKVHLIKNPKEFIHKYINDFKAVNTKYYK